MALKDLSHLKQAALEAQRAADKAAGEAAAAWAALGERYRVKTPKAAQDLLNELSAAAATAADAARRQMDAMEAEWGKVIQEHAF